MASSKVAKKIFVRLQIKLKKLSVGRCGRRKATAQRFGAIGFTQTAVQSVSHGQRCNRFHMDSGAIGFTRTAVQSVSHRQRCNRFHTGQRQQRQTAVVAKDSEIEGQEERREEQVQREREIGEEERTGGRMPREMHRSVSEAQSSKGSIWRKDEVGPGGLEVGSRKEKGPRRQTEQGSGSGSTSAQAMQDAGSGVVAGLNNMRDPNSIELLGRVLKRCQRSHQRLGGSGSKVSSGWRPTK